MHDASEPEPKNLKTGLPIKSTDIVHEDTKAVAAQILELNLQSREASELLMRALNLRPNLSPEDIQTARSKLAEYFDFDSSTVLSDMIRDLSTDELKTVVDITIKNVRAADYTDGLLCYDGDHQPVPVEISGDEKARDLQTGLERELRSGFDGVKEAHSKQSEVLVDICGGNLLEMVMQAEKILPFSSDALLRGLVAKGSIPSEQLTSPSTIKI
ncbi:hypothetical protein ISS85_04420 [Candidatus Microgenomates bacterium]|nr:hypothetical protein [Candidatus Microgenomates bacterium]